MSDRVTNRDLDALCGVINRAVNGRPGEPLWQRDDEGNLVANIGAYYIDGAYGGVALYRMVTPGGGVVDVLHCGHVPKRDLRNRLRAFIYGLEAEATK